MASTKKAATRKLRSEKLPEIFAQLRNTSVRCLESSLSCIQRPEDSFKPDKEPGSCLQLIRLGRQMKLQLLELKAELHARRLSREGVNSSLTVSLSVPAPLENEMWSVRNKELALMRMQTSNALLNALQEDAVQRRPIMGVMNHSMGICKQIMVLQQNSRQLEERLIAVRRRRIEMRMQQQELFQKLKYSVETNHKVRELEAKIKDKGKEGVQSITHKVLIIQEIFQRLVLSSQLNWYEDPRLRNLLLKMRDPPSF